MNSNITFSSGTLYLSDSNNIQMKLLDDAIPEFDVVMSDKKESKVFHMLHTPSELEITLTDVDMNMPLFNKMCAPSTYTKQKIHWNRSIMIQARWHKKYRTNKKWLKRYGMKHDEVMIEASVDSCSNSMSHTKYMQKYEFDINSLVLHFRQDQMRKNLKIEF